MWERLSKIVEYNNKELDVGQSTFLFQKYFLLQILWLFPLFNYRSTTFKKLAKGWGGIATPSGTEVSLGSGHWTGSTAITSITMFQPNGNWEADASFSLYGIKG
jgi:hypothetical protein